MKNELRLAQRFAPSPSFNPLTRPVETHLPPPQQQLKPTNRVSGAKGSSSVLIGLIVPPQSKGSDDDSRSFANPIPDAVEEVMVPFEEGGKIREGQQGENSEGGKEDKTQHTTIIIVATKENINLRGEDDKIHTQNHGDHVRGEFFKSDKGKHVTCVLQQLSLVPQQRDKTKTIWPSAIQSLPMVRRRRGYPSHFAAMRIKWKQKKTRGRKRKRQNSMVRSNYKHIKVNVRREGNTVLIHRHTFQFPIEANNRLKGHTCVLFRRMKRIKAGELLKYHPPNKPLYTNRNSWTSFLEVGEKNGRQKAQHLPVRIDGDTIVRDGLLLEKQQVQPQPCEPSTKSIEDHSLPLQQYIQFVQIAKVAEEHGEYLFKNPQSEEPPYSKVNSRTSFMLVGVTDVGQESHLVPDGLLFPRGFVLPSRLPTNGLMQEQSYWW